MSIKVYGNSPKPYQRLAFKNANNDTLFSQFKTYDEFRATSNQITPKQKINDKNKTRNMIFCITGILLAGVAILQNKMKPTGNKNCNELTATIIQNYKKTVQNFPQDEKYYQTLASTINLKPSEQYKLNSIIGAQQLKELLQKYTPVDFQLGKNFEGVKNYTYRVNLHNHTKASDGILSVEDFLEQARKWADRISEKISDDKPPFLIAITDHDTLDGIKEAVKILSQNPEKYRNLKVVLGSEISVSHINSNHVIRPVDFELIGYGLNPFNKKLDLLLENLKTSRQKAIETLISKIKEKYNHYNLSVENSKSFHANLEKIRTNGVLNLAGEYIEFKIKLTDFVNEINKKFNLTNNQKLNAEELYQQLGRKYYLNIDATGEKNITGFLKNKGLKPILINLGILNNENENIYNNIFNKNYSQLKKLLQDSIEEGLPTINDTKGYCLTPLQVFNSTDSFEGFFGVAHPALIKLKSPFGDNISKIRKRNLGNNNPNKNLVFEIFNELKQLGKDKFQATEINYQSYRNMGTDWINFMEKDIANNPLLNLFHTGGLDCHSPSIFSNHDYVADKYVEEFNLEEILGKQHEDFANMLKKFQE